MRRQLARGFSLLAAGLWWGSLSGLGLVVPLLFRYLDSPAAAGAMAARLFGAQTWLSVACTVVLLLITNQKQAFPHAAYGRAAMKFIVFGLLLALLVEFGVSPRIANARLENSNLKLWHALGSAMYFGQWLCAGAAVWVLGNQDRAKA